MTPIMKIRQFLTAENYEGILLRKTHNFAWVSQGGDSTIVRNDSCGVADWYITPTHVTLIVDETEKNRIIEEELGNVDFEFEIASCLWYEDKAALIATVIGTGNNVADTPFANLPVVDAQLGMYRSQLSAVEQARFRELCQASAQIVETVAATFTPGMSEHEVEAEIARACLSQGIHPQVILVSSDERLLNYRHPMPTHKPIENHVMIVLCGERGGLVANVTRLVHFGDLPAELAANQLEVALISATMMQATQPGVSVATILADGIAVYEAVGKPTDWQILHQGGLAGYLTREYLVTPTTEAVVKLHQAYAWNPMLPGVKCEDTFLVTEHGVDILTQTSTWPSIEVLGLKRPAILVRSKAE
ncbi:MAG: M24 family metallopeptidase [Culicoidibacterales bacterium]